MSLDDQSSSDKEDLTEALNDLDRDKNNQSNPQSIMPAQQMPINYNVSSYSPYYSYQQPVQPQYQMQNSFITNTTQAPVVYYPNMQPVYAPQGYTQQQQSYNHQSHQHGYNQYQKRSVDRNFNANNHYHRRYDNYRDNRRDYHDKVNWSPKNEKNSNIKNDAKNFNTNNSTENPGSKSPRIPNQPQNSKIDFITDEFNINLDSKKPEKILKDKIELSESPNSETDRKPLVIDLEKEEPSFVRTNISSSEEPEDADGVEEVKKEDFSHKTKGEILTVTYVNYQRERERSNSKPPSPPKTPMKKPSQPYELRNNQHYNNNYNFNRGNTSYQPRNGSNFATNRFFRDQNHGKSKINSFEENRDNMRNDRPSYRQDNNHYQRRNYHNYGYKKFNYRRPYHQHNQNYQRNHGQSFQNQSHMPYQAPLTPINSVPTNPTRTEFIPHPHQNPNPINNFVYSQPPSIQTYPNSYQNQECYQPGMYVIVPVNQGNNYYAPSIDPNRAGVQLNQ